MVANLPLILNGVVYQSDGSTVIADARVTARNERSTETLNIDTNSSGQYVMNCANFTSGYVIGDTVTLMVIYSNFEKSTSITLVEGVITTDLTVVAVPSSGDLRYFTVQEYYDYQSLTANNTETPSANTIVTVGLGVEEEIDRLCDTKFDSNDDSYYSVTDEYHDMNNPYQNTFFLRKRPVIAVSEFMINRASEGVTEDWRELVQNQIDACDATTDWAATTDGAITLNTTAGTTLGPKEGSGCLNISKTGGTQASVTFSKTMSTTYDFSTRSLLFDFYNENKSDLAASGSTGMEIRFGTDSSNYYYWQKNSETIAEGSWTNLSFEISNVTGTTGTPDRTACDYFAIILTYSAAATTVAAPETRLDDIKIGPNESIDVDLDTGRVKILDSINYPEVGNQQIKTTYTYGLSSVPNDIKKLAIFMTTRDLMKMSVGRGLSTGRDEFNPGNIAILNRQIESILSNRRYNTMYII